MRLVINALSTTNLSGAYVLTGHLEQWLASAPDGLEITVLCHSTNREMLERFGDRIRRYECPAVTAQWTGRARWERTQMAAALREVGGEVMLSMSGLHTAGVPIPEVTYAMNPWPLVPGMARTLVEKFKAALQRRGYRSVVKRAAGVAYLSAYMQRAYVENAGCAGAGASEVVYVGLGTDIAGAAQDVDVAAKFASNTVLCVSAMARHKGVETLVQALHHLSDEYRLILAGGWPDAAYHAEIEAHIAALKLSHRVDVLGHVSRSDLLELYRTSSVYALMSQCESFGIPSAEAQAFSTPVVMSEVCAMPEVCGSGGLYAAPGDAAATADQLKRLLSDRDCWNRMSANARTNSQRFTWESQSPILLHLLERCMKKETSS